MKTVNKLDNEKSYFVDNRAVEGQKLITQKVIAKITLCGVFEMTVYDYMN